MLKIISISFLCFLIAIPLGIYGLYEYISPAQDGIVNIDGLSQPASISFDARSIPYIEAANSDDLYFVQGVAMARDRLFQMDLLRRTANGQLSEIFGLTTVKQDKFARSVGFNRLAKADFNTLSPKAKSALGKFAQGINAYLASSNTKLPIEFYLLGYKPSPWRETDSLTILKWYDYQLSESWQLDELRQTIYDKSGANCLKEIFLENKVAGNIPEKSKISNSYQRTGLHKSLLEIAEADLKSTNIWNLLAQKHNRLWGSTAIAYNGTGSTIIGCNKDSGLSIPDLFYQCALVSPNSRTTGLSIIGIPGIIAGRNNYMGFASAALKADVQDIFLEEFSGLEKNKYKTSSGYKEAKIISEPIAVRFTGVLPYQVVLTNHGPALTKQDNFSVCLMWTGNSPGSAFDSLLEISEAKTMEEVSEACKNYRGSPQIYLFADRTGNIALSGAGLIPIRSNNGNGMLLQSGPASSGQWTGQLNTASIISSINPKDGILVSANEKPAGINSQLLLGHQWCAPYRAQRARNILKLTKDKNLTFDYPEANETMTDEEASIFALVKKRINEAAIALDIIDDNTQSTQKLLSKWNGQLKGNQPEALIYEAFLHHLVYQIVINKVQDQKLTNTYFKQYPMWILLGEYYLANKPDNLLPPNEANHNSFIISTLNLALQQVRQKTNSFNPEQWHWDSFHLAKFSNILVSGLPWLKPIINKTYTNLGGDENAIYSVNTMASGSALNYAADSGPVARILINMKNDDQIYQCLSGGQNGHFFSKSQNNELTTWSNLDILPVAVSQKRQESLVQHRLQLTSIYSNQ